jgi:hypothetical protein
VEQEWFYAEGEASSGPLSSDALIKVLRRVAEPGTTLVWRKGFDAWRPVREVPELARLLAKPVADAVSTPDPALDRWTDLDPDAESSDDDAPTRSKRRGLTIILAVIVIAVAIVGGATLASRLLGTGVEGEARVVLPTEQTRPQPVPAKPDPAVALAQLTEKAAQAAAATDAVALKLWASIEPPGMKSQPDYTTASRSDLEAYLSDIKTAEANAVAAQQQYAALLDAERGLIEEAARASGLDESSWSDLLATVDQRHATSLELVGRMLQARQELYRAVQAMQLIVIGEFGKYKVADGQVRFSNKKAMALAVTASERMNAANEALDRIEAQMAQARQTSRQGAEPAWKDMVIKGQAGVGAAPYRP